MQHLTNAATLSRELLQQYNTGCAGGKTGGSQSLVKWLKGASDGAERSVQGVEGRVWTEPLKFPQQGS